jgi:hypothetical protein
MYRKLYNCKNDDIVKSILGVFSAYIESGDHVALWLFKSGVIQQVLRVLDQTRTQKIQRQCMFIFSQLTNP